MSVDSSIIVVDPPSNPSLNPIAANKRPEAEISFQNLTYTIQIQDTSSADSKTPIISLFSSKKSSLKEKVIINNATGTFQPGSLTAILGPSGADKTALMNLLSGRISSGSISGNIWLNGRKADNGALHLVSRYINQEDILWPTMTVREALETAIRFRVKNITPDELELRVQYAIKSLKLERCQNKMIGNSADKGISTAQMKRTAIAMEVATNSSILLLDEPTSGLDSRTSITLFKLLLEIARSGQTVICAIEQPFSELFEIFDDVLVMDHGSVVYCGPRSQFVEYFSSIGFDCPRYINPADFLCNTVLNNEYTLNSKSGIDSKTQDMSDSSNVSSLLLDKNENSREEYLLNSWKQSTLYSDLVRNVNTPTLTQITSSYFKNTISFSSQFKLIVTRSLKNMLRDPVIVRVRVAQSLVLGLVVGLFYYKSNKLSPTISIQLPFQILYPILFTSIMYYMVGYRSPFSHFLIQCATFIMVGLTSFALGVCTLSFFDSVEAALSLIPVAIILQIAFGGVLINSGTGFSWIKWLQWINPLKYGFTSLATNQFKDLVIQGQPLGNRQLANLNLGPFGTGKSIAFLAMFFAIFILCAYIGLARSIRQTSKFNDRASKQKVTLMGSPDSKFSQK
ncbi:hypothetical protein BB560_006126 [Smittium megazygosporum]|uniref:ABC transporter domain-containing protein n=1 Tax=Smittium megazygosporum TaxID=133381 RepID=A0A2T9YGF3_9FUNG|nr:hypothetical protein BB560_006126 [Smittium megazygosporum]